MSLTKLANYFGFWLENSNLEESESVTEDLNDLEEEPILIDDFNNDLELVGSDELKEIIEFNSGIELEDGEYLERGITFSRKPYLKPQKYTKQISIGGTGGLMNYMLGIVQIVKENFNIDDCIVTGASGGCLSALYLVLPEGTITIDDFLDHHQDYFFCQDFLDLLFDSFLGSQGRVNYTCQVILKKILEKYFPNPETREKEILNLCHDRLFISTTKIRRFQNYVVNHWESLDDLINSILSSMTIPIWSQWSITRSYKNYWLLDGAFSNATPQIFLQMPTLNLECFKWRDFRYLDFYPSKSYQEHTRLKKLGMLDALEHLDDLERFFGQRAKCRQYLSDPDHPFHQEEN